MKAKEMRNLSVSELEQKLAELKEELFNLRFQLATGQLDNPMRIRDVRRDIARVKTLIRERELNIGGQEPLRTKGSKSERRGRNRRTRVGTVVNDKMDKTVV